MRIPSLIFGCLLAAALHSAPAQALVFGLSDGAAAGAIELRLNGGSIVLGTVDRGWYDGNGGHFTNQNNYVVAREADPNLGPAFNNFFVFNLSGLGAITQAVLRLNSFSVTSNESYTLFDFGGDVGDLVGGTGGIAAFNDLGSGTEYGSRDYTPADTNQIRDIALNASFIADINAAIRAQQTRFAFGGTVSDVPLQVPEPGTLLLLGAGLLGLGLTRRGA